MSPAPFQLAPLDVALDRAARSEMAAFALMVDAKGDTAAAFSKRATLLDRLVDKLTTGGLADKFKIAYRRVVDQAIGDKTLLVKSAGVLGNFLGKEDHVVNVETPFARTGFRHGRPLSR